jgi:catechol 2,3-dioxygenase-like lactoylglutathione lyase family enzyme
MIGKSNAVPTIGVSDLKRAEKFYGNVLGLKEVDKNPYIAVYASGNGQVQVYLTDQAGTNRATYVTWDVDDVGAEVNDLKTKGVTFEHYDNMEGVTREGEIHTMGSETAAWFKDPDGNILCLHRTD